MKTVAGWLLAAWAIYFLVTNPDGAAGFVHAALNGLQHAGNSLSQFASKL